MTELPRRGEVWLVALGAARPGEPGKTRPGIVMSSTEMLVGDPDELIVIIPVSSSRTASQLRVDLGAEVGLERPSRAICRAIRSVAVSRLVRRIGSVDSNTMSEIEGAISAILDLD